MRGDQLEDLDFQSRLDVGTGPGDLDVGGIFLCGTKEVWRKTVGCGWFLRWTFGKQTHVRIRVEYEAPTRDTKW